MKLDHIDDFYRGWVLGNFEPSLLKNIDFEFGVKYYKAGDKVEEHVHLYHTEYNILIYGLLNLQIAKIPTKNWRESFELSNDNNNNMIIDHNHKNGLWPELIDLKYKSRIIGHGDVFTIEPYEICIPHFLEDSAVAVIKYPHITNDKVIIERINI